MGYFFQQLFVFCIYFIVVKNKIFNQIRNYLRSVILLQRTQIFNRQFNLSALLKLRILNKNKMRS